MTSQQHFQRQTRQAIEFAPWQAQVLTNPFEHFAFFGGIGSGKSFTGAQFAIMQIKKRGRSTGLIGANTYDQLSQATLREFIYWLDHYGMEYVIDQIPPADWHEPRRFKKYNNIFSVRWRGQVSYVFTRVLSQPNPIRGVEISWYWIDETRDTEEYAHDMILGRCRESADIKGLITTTTNGESWDYNRFTMTGRFPTYGSIHVTSDDSVRAGIITAAYVRTLRQSYSPLMAMQELDAKHVNVKGGMAYYAASDANVRPVAPWGDAVPNRERPLIVGCDFNFSPAPCVWMIGQVGPPLHGANGEFWEEHIHWFKEISGVGISSPEMALKLVADFPDFFYEIYGDMSGNIGTTSNAGRTDYDQIGEVLDQEGASYTIEVEQMSDDEAKVNPRVRSRVENMNALFCNALGERRQTYSPTGCPLMRSDVKMVGWKQNVDSGRGKLDDGGDKQRTHATDGAGYAVYRKFPPGRGYQLVDSVQSYIRRSL